MMGNRMEMILRWRGYILSACSFRLAKDGDVVEEWYHVMWVFTDLAPG